MKKTVLITGSSSGLGRQLVKKFAGQGWNVAATMRSPEKEAEFTAWENVWTARLDVLDVNSIRQGVQNAIGRFGRIDLLINNAGYGLNGLFEGLSREKIVAQFETNVFGVMDVTRAILPHFRENRGGALINISSCGGLIGLPFIPAYSASKFALEGFTESLSFELASQNISVKLVEPGGFVSNFGAASEQASLPDSVPESYNEFLKNVGELFSGFVSGRLTGEEVADVVYEAATDGTDRLRYVIPGSTEELVNARNTMSDQAFIDYLRTKVKLK